MRFSFILLASLLTGCETVEPGEAAVTVLWGNISEEVLREGIHPLFPGTDVFIYSTRVQTMTMNDMATSSSDKQDVLTSVVLTWSRDPAQIIRQHEDYYNLELLIDPALLSSVKAVTGNNKIDTLINNRNVVRDNMIEVLKLELDPLGVIINSLSITDVTPNEGYLTAINQRVRAETMVQTAREEALEVTVRAEGQRKADILIAQGQAEALNIIGEALSKNPNVLELRRVEAWDGALPSTLVKGSSTPLLQLNK